jgi:hypothetical protein
MVLRSRTANGLHGRFIGDKFEDRTRNFSGHAIEKIKREPDAFPGVVGYKASRKEFSCGAARWKWEPFVAPAVFQEIDII